LVNGTVSDKRTIAIVATPNLATFFAGEKVMGIRSDQWTDEQLEAILDETAHWVVSGQQGRVLGFAASLRRAIDRYTEYGRSGAVVTSLRRLPSDNIVVLPAQVARLRMIITVREIAPLAAA
jgi:hypothetical protein